MRRLLGMVNVASTLFLRYPQVPVPGERSHRAFVVGIGDYISFGKLGKSVNDATDMATLLDAKGFCVSSVLNPTRSQFVEAFDKFCKDLGGARSAVVHYAGHGLAPLSESFLVAVDSRAGMPCADLLSVRRFVSVHPACAWLHWYRCAGDMDPRELDAAPAACCGTACCCHHVS